MAHIYSLLKQKVCMRKISLLLFLFGSTSLILLEGGGRKGRAYVPKKIKATEIPDKDRKAVEPYRNPEEKKRFFEDLARKSLWVARQRQRALGN